LEVVARDRASRLVPLVEVVELDAEDGRLESIEAAVVSSQLVEIATVTSAVVSELAYSAGELGVVSDDGATVPECAEVLSRVEAEARGMSERTYASPFPACAVGLGCVLDDGDPSPLGDLEDSRHVDRLTVEVHRDHSCGALVQCLGHAFGSQEKGLRIDIHEPRGPSYRRDGSGRGDERVGRHDHLVAGPDTQGGERQAQSVRAVGDPDRLFCAAVLSPPLLEILDMATPDETGGRHDRIPRLLEPLGQRVMHGREVEKRDVHPASSSAPARTLRVASFETGTRLPEAIARSPASSAATTARPLSPVVRGRAPVEAHSMKWLSSFISGSDDGMCGETMLP